MNNYKRRQFWTTRWHRKDRIGESMYVVSRKRRAISDWSLTSTAKINNMESTGVSESGQCDVSKRARELLRRLIRVPNRVLKVEVSQRRRRRRRRVERCQLLFPFSSLVFYKSISPGRETQTREYYWFHLFVFFFWDAHAVSSFFLGHKLAKWQT